MLSINPDAATREDIANMAAELMEARALLQEINDTGLLYAMNTALDAKVANFLGSER